MSALDDVTAAIQAAATKLGTDLTNCINDLKANTGAPTPTQIAALQAIATQLTSEDTTVTAADPGAAAATTPPAAS